MSNKKPGSAIIQSGAEKFSYLCIEYSASNYDGIKFLCFESLLGRIRVATYGRNLLDIYDSADAYVSFTTPNNNTTREFIAE